MRRCWSWGRWERSVEVAVAVQADGIGWGRLSCRDEFRSILLLMPALRWRLCRFSWVLECGERIGCALQNMPIYRTLLSEPELPMNRGGWLEGNMRSEMRSRAFLGGPHTLGAVVARTPQRASV
jgi:hypothetical protein